MITGMVAAEYPESILVRMDEVDTLEIEGRTWQYINESGFGLDEGDLVELMGFFEDGEYKISLINNLTTGESFQVRDEAGRPSWSGRGAGN